MKTLFKYFSFFLIGIFLINLCSANGLQILSGSMEINKTNEIDIYFDINITNQETFTFYNITSQNPIISFDKFNLNSGETRTINVKISSNENFNGEIKIIGEYYANLGTSNETETITINSEGLDLCNLDLIIGDTIIWKNTLSGDIKLKNLNSNEYFATINGNSNYTNKFQIAVEFYYQVYKTGLPFSNVCHLNIRPDSGYIHSSEYDSIVKDPIKYIKDKLKIEQDKATTKLANPNYVNKAPAAVVEKERENAKQIENALDKLNSHYERILAL